MRFLPLFILSFACLAEVFPDPAITTKTKFIAACIYDGQRMASKSVLLSSSSQVTNNQQVVLVTNVGMVTNIVKGLGSLEEWSITYKCSKCDMHQADYRSQIVSTIKSVRLP